MGTGASGSATGILMPPMGRRAQGLLGSLALRSWDLLPGWCRWLARESGIDPGLVCSGALRVMAAPPRVSQPGHEWLAAAALRRKEPALAMSIAGALYVPTAGHLQPLAVLDGLRAVLRRHRSPIFDARVTRLHRRGRRVGGVELHTGETITSAFTLVAAGGESLALIETVGRTLPITRDAGQIIQLVGLPTPSHLVLNEHVTCVGKPDGSLWLTGIHRGDVPPGVTLEDTLALWEPAAALFGREGRLQQAWSGVRPRAPRGIPFIGALPGCPGLLVAAGHGSNGYLLAPLTAQTIVDLIGGRAVPAEVLACAPEHRIGSASA